MKVAESYGRDEAEEKRTQHSPLLVHQRAQVPEDLRQLMNPRLNLPNITLSLLNQRLLVCELVWRELVLENEGLALLL